MLEAELQGSDQIGNAKDGFVRVVKADSFVHSARLVKMALTPIFFLKRQPELIVSFIDVYLFWNKF